MKKKLLLSVMLASTLSATSIAESNPNLGILTGDARTACEAILCLSSPHRPGECMPPLRKYFSLRAKKWHQTVTKRKNFLKLCPISNDVDIDSIANSRSSCDRFSFLSKRRLENCFLN